MRSRRDVIGSNGAHAQRAVHNQRRVDYAQRSIEEMAAEAARACHSGTIGVEIPIKEGKLGKVKRLTIVFEPE